MRLRGYEDAWNSQYARCKDRMKPTEPVTCSKHSRAKKEVASGYPVQSQASRASTATTEVVVSVIDVEVSYNLQRSSFARSVRSAQVHTVRWRFEWCSCCLKFGS